MRRSIVTAVAVIVVLSAAVMATTLAHRADKSAESDISPSPRKVGNLYYPTPKQWASLTVEPCLLYTSPSPRD